MNSGFMNVRERLITGERAALASVALLLINGKCSSVF